MHINEPAEYTLIIAFSLFTLFAKLPPRGKESRATYFPGETAL